MKIRNDEAKRDPRAISTKNKKGNKREGRRIARAILRLISWTPWSKTRCCNNVAVFQETFQRPYSFIKSLMTHWYQTTDTDTNASPCVVRSWWSCTVDETSSRLETGVGWVAFHGGGKPPRYRINFRAVESLKNLNFERKYEGWGNVSMFDKTFGQPLWKRIDGIFGTITNRVCRPDISIEME